MSDGGKGSAKRPSQITKEQFASNWDQIFGKSKQKQPQPLVESYPTEIEKRLPDKLDTNAFMQPYAIPLQSQSV